MPVSLPHPLTDGTTAYGSHTRANDDALAGKFTEGAGGISDADVSTSAAIKGTKLSSVAGSRVPTDRIEDDAVTADKLRDDATVDANRAVTTNHIRNLAVTKSKLTTTAGAKISLAQTEIKTQESLSVVVATGTTGLVDGGVVKAGRTLIGAWLRVMSVVGTQGNITWWENTAGANFQFNVRNLNGAASGDATVRMFIAYIENT